MDGEAMPQALWATVVTVRDACGLHHSGYLPPCRHAGHQPKTCIEPIGFFPPGGLPDAVEHIEGIQEGLRLGNRVETTMRNYLLC
jgi:hypothetical protein